VDFLVRYLLPRKFHLVCGTSIGGIIALLLGLEVPLSEIKKSFESKKYDIFPQRWGITKFIQSSYSVLWGGKTSYTDQGLRSLFNELAKDRIFDHRKGKYLLPEELTLKDLKFPCAVTSYDLNVNSVVYFTNLTAECQNIKIIDAILSTSAAPTYFPVHTFTCDDFEYQCVDGGLWGNDPRLFAFAFQRIFSHNRLTNILSFGTGLFQQNYINRKGHEDIISWATYQPNIISTLMNASTSQVEKIFEFGFKTGLIRQTKINISLPCPIDLADSNSLPLQKQYFEEEKNNKDLKTLTKFPENMKRAIELTWIMGCTTRNPYKENFKPEKIHKVNININRENRKENEVSKTVSLADSAKRKLFSSPDLKISQKILNDNH